MILLEFWIEAINILWLVNVVILTELEYADCILDDKEPPPHKMQSKMKVMGLFKLRKGNSHKDSLQ